MNRIISEGRREAFVFSRAPAWQLLYALSLGPKIPWSSDKFPKPESRLFRTLNGTSGLTDFKPGTSFLGLPRLLGSLHNMPSRTLFSSTLARRSLRGPVPQHLTSSIAFSQSNHFFLQRLNMVRNPFNGPSPSLKLVLRRAVLTDSVYSPREQKPMPSAKYKLSQTSTGERKRSAR